MPKSPNSIKSGWGFQVSAHHPDKSGFACTVLVAPYAIGNAGVKAPLSSLLVIAVPLENTGELLKAINAVRGMTKNIKPISVGDRSLKDTMLKLWVKENVGDESDDPNQYSAADEQWDEAVGHLQDGNHLPKGDGIVRQRDVFVHQLRAEMKRFGLNTRSYSYTQLVKKVDELKKIASASMMLKRYDGHKLTFTQNDIVNAENFIRHSNYTYDGGGMSSNAEAAVRAGKALTFRITLQLTEDKSSVFADSFDYYIHFIDADLEWYASAKATWSEGID